MKYKINFGNKVTAVPYAALERVNCASASELKALLCLCADTNDADEEELAAAAGISVEELREAVSFWRGAGVLSPEGKKDKKSAERTSGARSAESASSDGSAAAQKPETVASDKRITEKPDCKPLRKLRGADELPQYTSDELADILETRKDTALLIEECQNIVGKVFNVREINVLIGLADYLELDVEYIMMLLTYCVSIGKKTLHYAEKTAFALYDAGITDADKLSEELKRREAAASATGQIRDMFGIGSRALTTKEKNFISAWINDMSYSTEIIKLAYEVTANATGKASMPYANSVLERWNAAGLRTIEEIEESYKGDSGNPSIDGDSSFELDNFFAAAVNRSIG